MRVEERLCEVASYSTVVTCLASRAQQLRLVAAGRAGRAALLTTALSLAADLGLGWALHTGSLLPTSLTETGFHAMELTVRQLKTLLVWLMENPAGLKLNSVLSQALGNFFLYHIHLWVTYVMLVVPLLTPHLSSLARLAPATSLSLQLAAASDLFLLLTVHVHCFHAYGRRLAVSQYRGLLALWRLFLGKATVKYHHRHNKVDSEKIMKLL